MSSTRAARASMYQLLKRVISQLCRHLDGAQLGSSWSGGGSGQSRTSVRERNLCMSISEFLSKFRAVWGGTQLFGPPKVIRYWIEFSPHLPQPGASCGCPPVWSPVRVLMLSWWPSLLARFLTGCSRRMLYADGFDGGFCSRGSSGLPTRRCVAVVLGVGPFLVCCPRIVRYLGWNPGSRGSQTMAGSSLTFYKWLPSGLFFLGWLRCLRRHLFLCHGLFLIFITDFYSGSRLMGEGGGAM